MSPEQAAGSRDLDGRTDIYSLGCVLYEMLAGQPPFTGPTAESVVHQHLAAAPPSITGMRPAVPASVAAALQRALAKTPADRFRTVAQFAEALEGRVSSGGGAHPDRSDHARRARPPAGRARPCWPSRRWPCWPAPSPSVVGCCQAAAGTRHPRTAIAVLPLENLSAAGPHAYFAGGLHDELLTPARQGRRAHGDRPHVGQRVRGHHQAAAADRATSWRSGSIVEGSVQVVGNRLRVNVTAHRPGDGGASLGGDLRPDAGRRVRGAERDRPADRRPTSGRR